MTIAAGANAGFCNKTIIIAPATIQTSLTIDLRFRCSRRLEVVGFMRRMITGPS